MSGQVGGLIGRKLGMTRVFDAEGAHVPVTVIAAGPCPVIQVTGATGGAAGAAGPGAQVQLGFGERKPKRTGKAFAGHVKRAGLELAPHLVQSFVLAGEGEAPKPGDKITVAIFAAGDRVKITGITKGRGFQGVVHRYHFGGGPETHGNTRHRKPGSIAPGTDPSRIIKGKRMPGHMGARRFTELGLRVVRVDAERNLLFVRGAVPGSMNGLVTVRKQGGRSRHD
ncbi:MAG TPA: 50S ribosomal protein L3 [Gemmatimonadales bacterium]|jgi:large subunit ribosomal protein L3